MSEQVLVGDTQRTSQRFSVSKLPLSSLRVSGNKTLPTLSDSPTSSAGESPNSRTAKERKEGAQKKDPVELRFSPGKMRLSCQKCLLEISGPLHKTHAALCDTVCDALFTGRRQFQALPPSKQHAQACKSIVTILLREAPLVGSVTQQVACAASPRLAEEVSATAQFLLSLFLALYSVTFEKHFTARVPAAFMPGTVAYNAVFAFAVDRARVNAQLGYCARTGDMLSGGITFGQSDPSFCGAHGYDPQSALDAWEAAVSLKTVAVTGALPPILTRHPLSKGVSLGNMRTLVVDACKGLEVLPETFSLFFKLVNFRCSNCELRHFPRSTLQGMCNLETLDLHGNKLGPGPFTHKDVGFLCKLGTLDISHNRFWRPAPGNKRDDVTREEFSWIATEMPTLYNLHLGGAFAAGSAGRKEHEKWEKSLCRHLQELRKTQKTQINLLVYA